MTDAVQDAVREKYGAIAKVGRTPQDRGCCGPAACGCGDPITSNLYSTMPRRSGLPAEAVAASLGCGNPTALLALEPGQTVLDLGSGGGIDVLLSAKRVGPTGKAYGLDMTDEMLALARENQRKAGATNVEFLKGTIEAIPLPDNSVDVIISNCVINLSTRQGRGAARGVPRAQAGRTVRRLGRRRPRRRARRCPAQHGAVGRLHRGRARGDATTRQAAGRRFRRCRGRAVARLRHRGCARVPRRERRRCRSHGASRSTVASRARSSARASRRPRPAAARSGCARLAHDDGSDPFDVARLVAEFVGTALLLATVVGSGIMGERLAGGNVAIALLANTLATGAALVALILTFGPISGAHFNPAVTLADAVAGWARVERGRRVRPARSSLGALTGVALAHAMFGEPAFRMVDATCAAAFRRCSASQSPRLACWP